MFWRVFSNVPKSCFGRFNKGVWGPFQGSFKMDLLVFQRCYKGVLLYDRVWWVFEKCLTFSFFFCVRCAVIVFLIHFRVKRERLNILEAFLSNSTPTCRPNSTLVGWSRIWLCFPMSQEEEQQQQQPSLASTRRDGPTCLILGGFPVCVWRMSGRCLEGVWRMFFGCLKGIHGASEWCVWCLVSRCIWKANQHWSS